MFEGLDAQGWVTEGIRVYQLKEVDRAITCFENALKVEPENAAIWFNRAALLGDVRRFDEAIASLDRAIELDPEFADAIKMREKIRRDRARALLPPGRPGPTMVAMLANGGPAESYALLSCKKVCAPDEIAAMNWIVADVLFTAVTKDKRVFAFRYAGESAELADALVPQSELDAFEAMLSKKLVTRIGLCASKPFTAATKTRVAAINSKLDALGLDAEARIELRVIEEPSG